MFWKNSCLWLLILLSQQVNFTLVASASSITSSSTVEEKAFCVNDLNLAITEVINRPEFRHSHWGILMENMSSGAVIFAWNENKYFTPASNVKLLTTAAALRELGVNGTLQTIVYGSGVMPNLHTLRIRGSGDPTLTTENLKGLAQYLRELGVKQISRLMVEDGYLSDTGINPTWEWEDVYASYGVSPSSLILNQNEVILRISPSGLGESVILSWSDDLGGKQWLIKNEAITTAKDGVNTIRVEGILGEGILVIKGELGIDSEPEMWGLTIPKPSSYFLESLEAVLGGEGISVQEALVTNMADGTSLAGERALMAIASPTIGELVKRTNEESNNLWAEVLVALLDKKFLSETGIEVIKDSLSNLGVDGNSYQIVDGSGLSRQNLVSPKALVETLRLMGETPEGIIYVESLPVGGVSGTLTSRFVDTPVMGFVRAKTGTLSGVSSLSGYLELPNQEPIVFSILVSQSEQPNSLLRQGIDEMVLLMSRVNPRC